MELPPSVVGPGFILCGVGLLLYWCVQAVRQVRSRAWPSTTGVIKDAWVGVSSPRRQSQLRVRYSYQVDGKEYAAARIWFLARPAFTAAGAEEELRTRYPIGGEVTVFYDPTSPSTALLDRSSPMREPGGLIIGLITLGIGVWGVVAQRV